MESDNEPVVLDEPWRKRRRRVSVSSSRTLRAAAAIPVGGADDVHVLAVVVLVWAIARDVGHSVHAHVRSMHMLCLQCAPVLIKCRPIAILPPSDQGAYLAGQRRSRSMVWSFEFVNQQDRRRRKIRVCPTMPLVAENTGRTRAEHCQNTI